MKRFFALSALLFACVAHSAPVANVATWTAPTKNTDGSDLTLSQLTKYQLYGGILPVPDSPTVAPLAEPAGNANTATVTINANPGDTLYFRIRACSAGGCGPLSSMVTKIVPPLPVPNAPSGLTITITISLP